MSLLHQIWPVFSCPIFATKLNLKKEELQSYLKDFENIKYHNSDPNKKRVSLISQEYFLLKKNKYKKLKSMIMESLKFYNQEYLKYNVDFKMTTSWIAKAPKNTSSNLHFHSNSFISGVFYLQAEKNSGNIKFENVRLSQIQIPQVTESTIYNANQFYFVPEPNLLLFFPSWAYHTIMENESNKDRISIAFNFLPCSSFGEQDSQVNFSNLPY
jgi:uncharacterized protein (TIGR02466 family)